MRLLVLLACSSLVAASAQPDGRASFRRSNDPSGHCQYTFTVPSPEESSCAGGGGRSEVDGVLSRVTLLEALVSRLLAGGDVKEGLQETHSQVTAERDQLQQDKERLTRQIMEMQMRVAELSQEAETLRDRPCPERTSSGARDRPASDTSYDVSNGSYQEMKAEVTEVPASQMFPNANKTGCGELLSVGDPVTHRKAEAISGKYGVWLQDPEPVGSFYTNKSVWRIDAIGKEVRQLSVYEDMDQFAQGFPMKVLLLPDPVESTGATVYRGSLYYQRKRSRTLIRYDLATETLASRRELPHAGFHGQHPYSWGGYTDIDLAVDEQGLWAIYSTSKAKGAIVISKLDPETLEVKRSWETKIRKNSVANAFMVCGRLYTLASYAATNTTINYMFDTATGEGHPVRIPFTNRYRYNSMVDYNHDQRKLFSWDNFHMVTYDVSLGRPGQGSR